MTAPSRVAGAHARRRVALPRRDLVRAACLVVGACALVPATWPVGTLDPGPGLDPSWMTGLHMAVEDRLDFGTQAVFTYGPLGFLRVPIYAFAWTTRAAFAYRCTAQLLLAATMLWLLDRRLRSPLVAAAITLVVLTLTFQEPVPVLAFAACLALAGDEVGARRRPVLAAAVGALAAVEGLAKLSIGGLVLLLGVLALALPARRRPALGAWFAGGLLTTLVAGWLLVGQAPTAVVDYVRSGLQIGSGYSEVMGFEEAGRTWELLAALGLAVLGVVMILAADRAWSRAQKACIAAMWLVLAFVSFKEGFVRHEGGHANIFFATMLGAVAVLPPLRTRWPRVTSVLAPAVATWALVVSLGAPLDALLHPVQRSRIFLHQLDAIDGGAELDGHIEATRARLVQAYALDGTTLAALEGHSVHVEPHDTGAVWAYHLAWKPAPVFQSYVAYTAFLDDLNAASLASPRGPDRVLRHAVPGIDGRNPVWDSPAATMAMLCHFREIVTAVPWQVLGRAPDRCGHRRVLAQTRVRLGEAARVPPSPGDRSVVVMEIHGIGVRGLERLRTIAYRADERFVALDGGRKVRIVPGTAENGLVVRVPPAVDLPGPFRLDQGSERVTVLRGGGGQPDTEVVLRFVAVDLDP